MHHRAPTQRPRSKDVNTKVNRITHLASGTLHTCRCQLKYLSSMKLFTLAFLTYVSICFAICDASLRGEPSVRTENEVVNFLWQAAYCSFTNIRVFFISRLPVIWCSNALKRVQSVILGWQSEYFSRKLPVQNACWHDTFSRKCTTKSSDWNRAQCCYNIQCNKTTK